MSKHVMQRKTVVNGRWRAAFSAVLAGGLYLASTWNGASAEILVNNPAEVTVAATTAQPGDIIVMRDGVWADADILFSAQGTAAQPVTLRAQTLGRVRLTGQSRLRLAGNHLVVDGLTFTNGFQSSGHVIAFQESSAAVANHSRLINCAIVDYNPPNLTNDTKWVSLYGVSNRVENCYFVGKANVGATLVVWVGDVPNYHVVSRNHFGPRPVLTAASNGGETIRVGTSDVSFNQSHTVVEDNFFERCNGDVEIISSKSCGNTYRRNTFLECEGALTLRHGNGCVVEGNYFFGNNKPLTGGVRIIGEDHKVYNNYFENLAGTSSRAPLAVMLGLVDSPLNGYFQVKRATVAFNTFVNCNSTLLIGLSATLSGNTTTLVPVDCVFANNLVVQPTGSRIVDQRVTPQNLLWEGNIFHGTALGITTNSGTVITDPLLTASADGVWRPGAGSPALSTAVGTYSYVTHDFEGHVRPALKDVGADQASVAPRAHPQTSAATTGPLWMRVSGTVLTWNKPAPIAYGSPLTSLQLNASANAAGTLVYNPPLETVLEAGLNQTLSVVFTPVDTNNFNAATQTVSIDVLQAVPSIHWTNPAPIVYGAALSPAQLNASVNVSGALLYDPPLGTVLNSSAAQTLTVHFMPDDTVNFTMATGTVTIAVAKATPAVAWPVPAAIERGATLGAGQLNAVANVPGTFEYNPGFGTLLEAGSGQLLSVTFTPDDLENYLPVTQTNELNVTIGGKTLPKITWNAPLPILQGTPLGPLQLNATANAPGTFTYSPADDTVLPIGNDHVLNVTFTPNNPAVYTSASKSVTIDVVPLTSNTLVRIAYIVPSNRVPQAHAAETLKQLIVQHQDFFAQQMEHNGFGRKTFAYETEPDGVTPFVHVLNVPPTDSFLRNDIYGGRVVDAARAAGLPVGAPGQIWWLIPETHVQHPDGTVIGGFEMGVRTNVALVESGWAISSGERLALYQLKYQTNSLLYDGSVIPEIGPYAMVQDVSFPWFEGITLSGVSSSAVGAGLRSIGAAFGLASNFRNDENFNGNLMGFGFRGIRGNYYPDRYIYNYCSLSFASALTLSVHPFFNPGREATDLAAPNVSISTSGTIAPVSGLVEISFNATDDQALHAAVLTWESAAEFVVVDEMMLSGTSAGDTFRTPYYSPGQTNRYRITVYDELGNQRTASTIVFPTVPVNQAPQPFIRVSPIVVGLGEDVRLDAFDTFDPEHTAGLLEVEWDLTGDGSFNTVPLGDLLLITSFTNLGPRLIRARVTDPAGDVAVSAPVAINVVLCDTELSPVSRSHGYGGGNNRVTVTARSKCRWTPITTNEWITLLEGPEFVGSAVVNYYVEPNPDFFERKGYIFIGDQIYTVVQQPAVCNFSVSPTNRFHGYGSSSSGTVKVTTKAECSWVVVNTNNWITIVSGSSGTGTGTVSYVLSANRVEGRRTGQFQINDRTFTITQWGTNCQSALTPVARTHGEGGDVGSFTISTAGDCEWSALNTNDWITLTSPSFGMGSSNVTYLVQPNPSLTPRVGVITAGEETFTIIQSGCTYSLSASGSNHFFSAQSGTINVTAGSVCEWSVENPHSWISINSPLSWFGNGTVQYSVQENPINVPRSATITVAGLPYVVSQDRKPCNYMLDAPEGGGSHPAEGGFEDIAVTADAGCSWTATTSSSWITILFGASGDGSGTVTYQVARNDGPARSGTIEVNDKDYVVSQASGVRDITLTDMTLAVGQTNSIVVKLDAHGGENALNFSLCFDTNLLTFVSAALAPSAPVSTTLSVSSDEAAVGRVGFTVAVPTGFSMPAGTGTAVQVWFTPAPVNGKPITTISVCDAPVARQLVDAIGNVLTTTFNSSKIQVLGICTLAESLDATNLTFTTGSNPWTCTTEATHDLEDAAVSGPTPDNGESYMETTLIGPGTLSFFWKVSSEQDDDRLRLYMDGSAQFGISGEVDWEWRTFAVPNGTHTIRWRYNKNTSLSGGQDRAWVDQVVYDPAAPVITSQPASQSVDSGSTAVFSVSAAGQPPLTYQWRYNHVPLVDGPGIQGANSATLTLQNVQPSQAGSYSVVVTAPQGSVNSASAQLSVTQILPLAEALDTDLPMTNGGNQPWVGQSGVSHDGIDAGRSGTIGHSQSSSFQTIISGPGTLSFWWKVSSESGSDRLRFYINGSEQHNISGEVDWVKRTYNLSSGQQTLLWTYQKGSSGTVGQDRGWVDEIVFIPTPVSITGQPTNQVVDQGSTATLSVGVSGTPPITYQWFFDGLPISGANSASYVIPNVQPVHDGRYSVLVSNNGGSQASSNAVLRVNLLVPLAEAVDATNMNFTLTGSPQWVGQMAVSQDGVDAARSGRIGHNGTTTFQTTVAGPGTISFWWKVSSQTNSDRLRFYMGGSEQQQISGEVDWAWRTWTVPSGNQTVEWRYTKNSSGQAGEDTAWVDQIRYVPNNTPTPPFMAIQPTNRTVISPGSINLVGVAGGSTPLSYQWHFNGAPLANGSGVSGVTTTNLVITGAAAAHAGVYTLVVTNGAGSTESAAAELTVITAPVITSPPTDKYVVAGSTVSFTVGAVGQAPLSYQWLCNGTNIINGGKFSGATTATLTIANVQSAQEGTYSVIVSNAAGVASSLQGAGSLRTWTAARSATVAHNGQSTIETTVTGPGTIKFAWKVSSQTNNDAFVFSMGGVEQARISGEVDWQELSFPVSLGAQTLRWVYVKDAAGSAGLDAGLLDGVEFVADGAPVAPSIAGQPANVTTLAGTAISITADVQGSAPISYEWRFNGNPLQNSPGVTGVRTPRLTLSGVQPNQAGQYSLLVSNAAGAVISSNATLTVNTLPAGNAPVIVTPPASLTASENSTAVFHANVTGAGPLIYHWLFNGEPLANGDGISGTTTATLSLSNVQPSQVGNYTFVVSNGVGRASARAALNVMTLGEAVNAPYIQFLQAGNASWIAQTNVSRDGAAVKTGNITHGENTRLEAYVEGPGTITFWWKVSTEGSDDNLRFYIGANTEMVRISGEVDWQQQTWAVPAGTQLLKWRFGKGASGSGGQDAGWVDNIVYTPGSITVAPFITNQPTSQVVMAGTVASLSAEVGGSMPMTFQWYSNSVPVLNGNGVTGARMPRLTLLNTPAQSATYMLVASNAAGTISSVPVTLNATSVVAAPVIANHPTTKNVSEGATVNFSVTASGAAPLHYQWLWNGAPLADSANVAGASSATLTLQNVQLEQIGSYSVVVSNSAGLATSDPAALTVQALGDVVGAPYLSFAVAGNAWSVQNGESYTPGTTNGGAQLIVSISPSITSQPTSKTLVEGVTTAFTVGVTGSTPLFVQWRLNGVELQDGNGIGGVNTPTLTITGLQPTDAGTYSVWISNAVGAVTSANAVLTVLTPPSVVTPPSNLTVNEGASAVLSVVATGTTPMSYQWQRNGTNIVSGGSVSGATGPTLTLNNAQPSQAGIYTVTISNAAGGLITAPVELHVNAAMTLAEGLNAPYLTWNSLLGAPWTLQTNITHDGEAAAQSGNISHSETTWLETTVVGPGTIRFWWKVSSQTNSDVLAFSVDGSTWVSISGEVDWQRLSYAIPGGQVTLRWTYTKNGSGTSGLDRGWLDEVDYVPTTGPSMPVIVQEPVGQDVDPGANVTLSVVALGSAPLSYQWRFEGRELADGGNVLGSKTPNLVISSITVAQAGAYDCVVRNPYSLDVSEQVFVSVVPIVPLHVALDTDHTNMIWITGASTGAYPWRGQTNVNSDRIDAAQSGVLSHNQTNFIRTVVDGPGAITFWWRSSSQTNSDRLRFTINGVEMANISGETDWRQRTFPVDLPNSELRWSYTKDGSGSAGLDRAWVDLVTFGPTAPVITNTSQEVLIVDQGTTIRFNVDAIGSKPFSYQWKFNGTNLVNSATNGAIYPGYIIGATGDRRLVISNAQPYQSGTYVCEISNPGGLAISPPFTLLVVPSAPLSQALNSNLVWETEGYTWWVGSTNIHRDGLAARNGGPLPNSDSTTLRTTVQGPGTLSFWWRASTETNVDLLTFEINGSAMATISGNHNWQQKTYDLGSGSQRLEWIYNKSGLLTNNMDQVFVDQVVFGPILPIVTNQPVAQTADQGSTVQFTAGIRGTPPLTYQWLHNGSPLVNGGNVSGANTATLRITGVQLEQAGNYSLQVGNVVGTTNSLNALLTVLPTFPIAEALDHYDYVWTTGNPGWIGQNITTFDGVDAVKSPVTGNSSSSSMQATIAGPGALSFWWKVSSQTNGDELIFYTNNTRVAGISGEVGWTQRSLNLVPGNHVVRWSYTKNSSTVAGQDRGWVDQLVFIPTPPTVTTHPAPANVDQHTSASFSVAAAGTPPMRYQWRHNGNDISGATNAILTLDNVQPSDQGNYSVVVANAAGSATSQAAALTVNTIVPLEEALDGTNFVWTTTVSPSSVPTWLGQLQVNKDGVDAARIQSVPHNGLSSFQTTLTGPGTVSFWWKVSSQTNGDYLTFYTNNTQALRISGEVDWRFETINIGSGNQTLRWTYSKNGSTSTGQDRAWVDQVNFGAVAPTIVSQPANRAIDAGASTSFSVGVAGTPPFTYQWQRNNQDLFDGGGINGVNTSNLTLTGVSPEQAGSYRVLISGQGGATVSSAATLTVYPTLPLEVALDTPGLTWTTNGTPPWIGHGLVSRDGVDAARSGAIGDNGSNSMTTVLTGPVTVSYWWKVSSQTNSDWLSFYTNGTRAVRISGEVDWEFQSFNFGAGNHTLTWAYTKNGSGTAGQDRGWVDQVAFGVVPPVIVTHPSNVASEPGNDVIFSVVAGATPPVYYQWLFNGSPIQNGPGFSGANAATLLVSNASSYNLGLYSVIVSNAVGTAMSSSASLILSTNVTLNQAMDGGLNFTTGGTGQPWKGQTAVSRDGQDAGQTGDVGNSTYTWIKTTVTGPGPLSFWWKVSSEENHDYLRFMVDAVDQVRISGEVDWQLVTYNVPSGTHELQWRYSKNSSLAEGADRGWVDYIYFNTTPPPIIIVTATPPAIVVQPASQSVEEGDIVTINVGASGTGPLTYRWFHDGTNLLSDGGNIGGATTSELTIYNITPGQAGNYSVIVSNSLGALWSGVARMTVLPVVDLAESVDSFDLFFTTVGEAPWIGHTVVTHDGIDAARSGRVFDGQSSTLETMVNGPGYLSFWWKVSSETNADHLSFFINGVPQESISGEVGWKAMGVVLPEGPQILEWTYSKNGTISTNADRAWLDQISWVPNGSPPDTNNPTGVMSLRLRVEGDTLHITWDGSAAKTYKVYYKDQLEDPWTLLDSEVLVTWKVVNGEIVPDLVTATVSDGLGTMRFYKVLEF